MMTFAIETATAMYLHGAEPSLTVIRSRAAQPRVRVLPEVPLPKPPISRALSATEAGPTVGDAIIPLNSSTTPADSVVAQLIRFEQFEADWDGNDAAKPLLNSLKNARAFIRALAPESVIPRPALHADGHAILFIRAADLYGELEFLGDNKIGYHARRGGQKWGGEIFFDGQSLPDGLSQIGFSL